ncbi:hypothetical protein SISSUDRAFT_1065927 [Sistotremastrum suecicum HHB10207 ss-3]|uniref:F-box domain-containing protein n=1 Tax=Sistotremastrum suecicum HHB10207 ss-3 TaxID=1314776 RepID=A0A165YXQ8_9AGAM|nr:hypothetical protein SISSUDRAFT_1065927 [Sistotremastrum suecicum HHB10207 ss-3]
MSLLSALPLELLFQLLRTLSIPDILSLAQTCRTLMTIVQANFILIAAESSTELSFLPIGMTLEDMSPEYLYALAIATTVSFRRLSRSQLPLHPRDKRVIPLNDLVRDGDDRRYDRRAFQSNYLWSHDEVIICNHRPHFMLFIHIAAPSRGFEFEFPGHVEGAACQLLENNVTLIMATLIRDDGATSYDLYIEEFDLAQDQICGRFRHVKSHAIVKFPQALGVQIQSSVIIRDPFVAVIGPIEVIIVDWRAKTGYLSGIRMMESAFIYLSVTPLLEAAFHAEEPTLFIQGFVTQVPTIFSFDISHLSPLQASASEDSTFILPIKREPATVHEVFRLPRPRGAQTMMTLSGTRYSPAYGWVLEAVTSRDLESYMTLSLDSKTVVRDIGLRNDQVPDLEIQHPIQKMSGGISYALMPRQLPGQRPICVLNAPNQLDEFGRIGWVHLLGPDFRLRRGNYKVAYSFDFSRSRLCAFMNNELHIYEY